MRRRGSRASRETRRAEHLQPACETLLPRAVRRHRTRWRIPRQHHRGATALVDDRSLFARGLCPRRDQRARGGTRSRRLRGRGQLTKRPPVPRKEAELLNALHSSRPAGQRSQNEERPERDFGPPIEPVALSARTLSTLGAPSPCAQHRELLGRKRSGPEDRSWGPLLTGRSSKFARPIKWLQRKGSNLQPTG